MLRPACTTCVGRIRYLGVILYDADRIHETASVPEKDLIDHHLSMLVGSVRSAGHRVREGERNRGFDATRGAEFAHLQLRQRSGGWPCPCTRNSGPFPCCSTCRRCCRSWPRSRQVSNREQAAKLDPIAKVWEDNWLYDTSTEELWGAIDQARFPLKYLANLFGAGDEGKVKDRLKKLWAIRIYRRWKTVGDITEQKANDALRAAGYTPEMADAVYYLTSLAKFDDRFAIPAAHREQAIEMLEFTGDRRGSAGFGFKEDTMQQGAVSRDELRTLQPAWPSCSIFRAPSSPPADGHCWTSCAKTIPTPPSRWSIFSTRFPQRTLDLQELHTRTFDVQSLTTLDIGYVLFGDDYKRGALLSNLNQEHSRAENDCRGELADHLPNLLRLIPKLKDQDLLERTGPGDPGSGAHADDPRVRSRADRRRRTRTIRSISRRSSIRPPAAIRRSIAARSRP